MHIPHDRIDVGLSQKLASFLVFGDNQQKIQRDADDLHVLFALLHRRVHDRVEHLVLHVVVSVEVRAHAVDNALQTAVGVPVIDQLVPVVLVQHDVANHVDDAFPTDGVRRVDVGDQLVDQVAVLVHDEVAALVELRSHLKRTANTSDVVENRRDVLVGIGFGALHRGTEEPQNKAAEVETLRMRRRTQKYLQFALLLTELENGSCTNVVLAIIRKY